MLCKWFNICPNVNSLNGSLNGLTARFSGTSYNPLPLTRLALLRLVILTMSPTDKSFVNLTYLLVAPFTSV